MRPRGDDQHVEFLADRCNSLRQFTPQFLRLKQRRAELEEELSRLDRTFMQNESVWLEAGRLVLTPLTAEDPPEGSIALKSGRGTYANPPAGGHRTPISERGDPAPLGAGLGHPKGRRLSVALRSDGTASLGAGLAFGAGLGHPKGRRPLSATAALRDARDGAGIVQ